MHLTLFFLGDRGSSELPEVEASVRAATGGIGAFALRPLRLGVLPERGAKRSVVAFTDRPPALLELHERLAQRFARRWRPHARERFVPHLTLARFPGAGAECGLERPLAAEPFRADRVELVASVLHPTGAVHRPLAVIGLGP